MSAAAVTRETPSIGEPNSFLGQLQDSAARRPTQQISFPGTNESYDFAELLVRAERIAGGLRAGGTRPGDVVALLMPTGPDFLPSFLGVMRADAVPTVLMSPPSARQLTSFAARYRAVFRDARVRRAIVDPSWQRALVDVLPGVDWVVPQALLQFGAAPKAKRGGRDLALLQYTSGSTSAPKGVAMTHENLSCGVPAVSGGVAAGPEDVWGCWLPMFHDMGLMATLSMLLCGAEIHLWTPYSFVRDPAGWLAQFAAIRGTLYAGPNFSYAAMLEGCDEAQLEKLDLSSWRIAYNGAEPIDWRATENFVEFFSRAGFRREAMYPVYGLAEATLAVSFPDLGVPLRVDWVDRQKLANDRVVQRVLAGDPAARAVVSVGRAVKGLRIRVVGEDGRRLPEDRVGEIEIAGTAVMDGYFRNPQVSSAVRHGEWFRTGDLGYFAQDELHITGRQTQMLIINGVNYHPEDCEMLVATLPGVFRSRSAALRLGGFGDGPERLVMVVETDLEDSEERSELAGRIAGEIRNAMPLNSLEIVLVEPRTVRLTSSGKVQRDLTSKLLVEGQLQAAILHRWESASARLEGHVSKNATGNAQGDHT